MRIVSRTVRGIPVLKCKGSARHLRSHSGDTYESASWNAEAIGDLLAAQNRALHVPRDTVSARCYKDAAHLSRLGTLADSAARLAASRSVAHASQFENLLANARDRRLKYASTIRRGQPASAEEREVRSAH